MSLLILRGTSSLEKAIGCANSSVFNATIAIAADASLGVIILLPIHPLYAMEPLTSIPSKYLLFVGVTCYIGRLANHRKNKTAIYFANLSTQLFSGFLFKINNTNRLYKGILANYYGRKIEDLVQISLRKSLYMASLFAIKAVYACAFPEFTGVVATLK